MPLNMKCVLQVQMNAFLQEYCQQEECTDIDIHK